LFSYRITYKVITRYTPYYLVYGLHPLILIEYVLLAISGDHKDAEPTKVLTTRNYRVGEVTRKQSGSSEQCWGKPMSIFLWSQQKQTNNKFQFPKGEKTHPCKFKKRWFAPFKV